MSAKLLSGTKVWQKVLSYPPLDCTSEIELIIKSQAGCANSRDLVILHNMRFARLICLKYAAFGAPLEDLLQEAVFGLTKALNKFKVDSGYKFVSYAVWWIRREINNYITSTERFISLPRSLWDQRRRYYSILEEQPRLKEDAPLFNEWLKKEKISPKAIQIIDSLGSDPLGEFEPVEFHETLELNELNLKNCALQEERLLYALQKLQPAELELLERVSGLNRDYSLSIRQEAARENISFQAVHLRYKKIICKLKESV